MHKKIADLRNEILAGMDRDGLDSVNDSAFGILQAMGVEYADYSENDRDAIVCAAEILALISDY